MTTPVTLVSLMLLGFVVNLIIGPRIFAILTRAKQPIRSDGPSSHLKKTGTPTMGGLATMLSFFGVSLACVDLTLEVITILAVTFAAFTLGFIDDWQKLRASSSKGVPGKVRLAIMGIVVIAMTSLLIKNGFVTEMMMPLASLGWFSLGWLYPIFAFFVIVGTANAVNLTDGLDGLASLPISLCALSLGAAAFIAQDIALAQEFKVFFAPEFIEVTKLCMIMAGASLAFLWYNGAPAQIFMGDTGSMAQGAFLGTVAVILHQEWLLFVLGGLFVLETLSVIIQVLYFKRTKKRIFRMAPIHHHFELAGWPESKVVLRFWLAAVAFTMLGFVMLFMRAA